MHDNPPKRRNGTIVALVIAAVAVLLVGGTALFVRVTTTIQGQALPAGAGPATTSSTPDDPLRPKPTGGPRVPGWRVIELSDGNQFTTNKAYDVPSADWQLVGGQPSVTWGKNQEVRLYIPTVLNRRFCGGDEDSWQSLAGMIFMPNKGDLKVGGPAAAQLIAEKVFTLDDQPPKVEMSAPQPTTVLVRRPAVLVTAKVTADKGGANGCPARTATIVVMMMEPNNPGEDSVGMLAMTINGVPGATPDDVLQRIATSIHDVT